MKAAIRCHIIALVLGALTVPAQTGVRYSLGARGTARTTSLDGRRRLEPATTVGLLAGLVVAAAIVWLVQSLLVVSWFSAVTSFIAVPVLLASVAVIACLPVAFRAVRTDPAAALRGL